jgi:hypothetical protein
MIIHEWLEARSSHRTFGPTWAPSDYTGIVNYVDAHKFVDTDDRGGMDGPAVMDAIDPGPVQDTQCPDAVRGETWFKAVDTSRGGGRGAALDYDNDLGNTCPKHMREDQVMQAAFGSLAVARPPQSSRGSPRFESIPPSSGARRSLSRGRQPPAAVDECRIKK